MGQAIVNSINWEVEKLRMEGLNYVPLNFNLEFKPEESYDIYQDQSIVPMRTHTTYQFNGNLNLYDVYRKKFVNFNFESVLKDGSTWHTSNNPDATTRETIRQLKGEIHRIRA